MFSSLTLTAAFLAPAAPMPKDTTPTATGPAPQVIYLSAAQTGRANVAPAANRAAAGKAQINLTTFTTKKVEVTQSVVKNVNGKNQVEKVKREVEQRIPTSKPLGERGEVFTTVDGSTLTKEEAIRRLSAGAVALISLDGKPIDAGWLRVINKDVITIHSSEITSQVSSYSTNRNIKTPAPRLAMLTPDPDGTIRVAIADSQQMDPAIDGNNVVFGNGRVIVQGNINIAIAGGLPAQAEEGPAAKPAGKPGEKIPLDKINFEAYTANGESVTKEAALQRLKAGGIVAIAGSNQKPDETYLKSFDPNLLVLVAADLVKGAGGGSSAGGIVMPGGVIGGGIARPLPIQIQAMPAQIVPAPEKPDADTPAKPGDNNKPADNPGAEKPAPGVKPVPRPAIIRPVPAGNILPLPVEKVKEVPKS